MRITACEPWKSGEHRARAATRSASTGGQPERQPPGDAAEQAVRKAERKRRIHREICAERRRRGAGQNRRHQAVDVHADVHPRDADAEPSHAECEAKERRASGRRGRARRVRTARLTPGPAATANSMARTSRRGSRRAATQRAATNDEGCSFRIANDRGRSIVPARAGVQRHADAVTPDACVLRRRKTLRRPSFSADRVTRKRCGRRASARITSNRRSSSSTTSPRLGTRPSRSVSNPPIVSNAESDSACRTER